MRFCTCPLPENWVFQGTVIHHEEIDPACPTHGTDEEAMIETDKRLREEWDREAGSGA
jgi:hypothetical protein